MTQISCSSCGRENSPQSRFCQYCGTSMLRPPLGSVANPETSPLGNAEDTPSAGEQEEADNVYVPLPPGTRLRDRYVIQQQLGQGGFGRTYRAEDTGRFNEIIVLKELTPTVQGTYALKKAEELFQREAATLHRLEHPQIPRFWEIFTAQKRLFLVEDFAAGLTYQQLLEGRQQEGHTFNEMEVTQLFRDLLPVLSYLHGQGVIHRDISPDNIILRHKDGLPILIDLGGVKQVAMDVATEVVHHQYRSPGASTGGTRLGKIGYAPDEQMRLGLVAPHSDLYALAVTALVLMTGQPPQQLQDPQSLEWLWQRQLSLSPHFTNVLNKMLAPRPVDRYQSATEVIQALNTQIEPPPTQIMQPPPISGIPTTVTPAATTSAGFSPPSPTTPFSSPSVPQLVSLGDDQRKSNVKLWAIAGGLSVAIMGILAFFGYIGSNQGVDPVVSTLESSSPTVSESPDPSPSPNPSPTSTPNEPRQFQSVEIGKLQTFSHQSNVFSLLVPDNWTSKDNSKPGEVIVLWTDPTRNGGLVADIFDVNYDPTQQDLTKLLQDFLKNSFEKEPDFFLRDPKPQKDGSILLIWGYTAKATGNVDVKLLGNSFIEHKGRRIAILSFIVPDQQFSELEKPLNRIINNYKINTTTKIP